MKRNWLSNSRTGKRVANNLGVIWGQDVSKIKRYRKEELHLYDQYYDGTQYDKLIDWDQAAQQMCEGDDFIGVRKRKPRINIHFAEMVCSRLSSKLIGESTFPLFEVADNPESTEFIKQLIKWAKLKSFMLEPTRRMVNTGSEFVRFYFVEGQLKLQRYCSKYCYPEFSDVGNLKFIKIQYVWCDYNDLDEKGKPREKWYRIDLGETTDVLYDNPEYSPQNEPQFEVVETVQHDFGFVQGTWMRTCEEAHSPDGVALAPKMMDIIDELNYSFSQSSQAVSYNQEPILTLKGMDTDEIDHVVKTSAKALNLGRDGEASYLETSLTGVEAAGDLRDRLKNVAQEVVRTTLLDPEKIVGSAQSGKAMEVLHGPMIDYILELRPLVESFMMELVAKMMAATMIMTARGEEIAFQIPEGFQPSFDLEVKWPEVFPMTLEDMQKKVSLAVSAASANIISREAMTRWLARDFNIEDIEAELAKIAAQPQLNTWGGF
jgi:hypothetical protein